MFLLGLIPFSGLDCFFILFVLVLFCLVVCLLFADVVFGLGGYLFIRPFGRPNV